MLLFLVMLLPKLTTESKFFVKANGDSVLQKKGILNDREIKQIQMFIKERFKEMYLKWQEYSTHEY